MKNIQLDHNAHKKSLVKYPVSILLDNVLDGSNVGTVFRLSDALGVEKIYLCKETPIPPNKLIKKTSRSTEKYVKFEYSESSLEVINKLKLQGYIIIALEITNKSISIRDFDFSQYSKICIIAGSEISGISEAVLEVVDYTVNIPMIGVNSSMNISNSVAIAIYEITGCIGK